MCKGMECFVSPLLESIPTARVTPSHLPLQSSKKELYHWIPQCLDAKISQADLSAYAILYIYGGIYADMDTMPLVNLDALMESSHVHSGGKDVAM